MYGMDDFRRMKRRMPTELGDQITMIVVMVVALSVLWAFANPTW